MTLSRLFGCRKCGKQVVFSYTEHYDSTKKKMVSSVDKEDICRCKPEKKVKHK